MKLFNFNESNNCSNHTSYSSCYFTDVRKQVIVLYLSYLTICSNIHMNFTLKVSLIDYYLRYYFFSCVYSKNKAQHSLVDSS